jgi:hypothetical protein
MDQAAAGFLQGERDRASAEALAQWAEPLGDGFGCVGEGEPLGLVLARHEQTEVVFLIGPIQADHGGVFDGSRVHETVSFLVGERTRWLWRGEGIIVETLGTSGSGVFVESTRAHRPRAKRLL